MNSLLLALQTDTPHLLNVTKTVRVLSYGHSVMKALSGKHFFGGANYIKRRDNTRPVHYEGLQNADSKYYYTELVDMVSMMYPID